MTRVHNTTPAHSRSTKRIHKDARARSLHGSVQRDTRVRTPKVRICTLQSFDCRTRYIIIENRTQAIRGTRHNLFFYVRFLRTIFIVRLPGADDEDEDEDEDNDVVEDERDEKKIHFKWKSFGFCFVFRLIFVCAHETLNNSKFTLTMRGDRWFAINLVEKVIIESDWLKRMHRNEMCTYFGAITAALFLLFALFPTHTRTRTHSLRTQSTQRMYLN